MRKGAGKAKGSAFERQVARDLSGWLSGGTDDKQLIRSVLSGGWSRGQKSEEEGWRQVGDLAPNGPLGERFRRRYAVECKHRRAISVDHIFSRINDKDGILAWWQKLRDDSHAASVLPMLVFRSNGKPVMVATVPLAVFGGIIPRVELPHLDMIIFEFKRLMLLPPTLFVANQE